MSFSRVNVLGWAFGETLTSAQMNAIDINTSRAVDGFAGGTYNPSAGLVWNENLQVDTTVAGGPAIQGTAVGGNDAVSGTTTGGTGDAVFGVALSGRGVYGLTTSGIGVEGKSSEGYGVQAEGDATPVGNKASFRIVPQGSHPGSLDEGAVWIRSDVDQMYAYMGGAVQDIISKKHAFAPQAWGYITTDGVGGRTELEVHGCSTAINVSVLDITMANDLSTAYWVLAGTAKSPVDNFLRMVSTTVGPPSVLAMTLFDHGAGAVVDLSATATEFNFVVFGVQA